MPLFKPLPTHRRARATAVGMAFIGVAAACAAPIAAGYTERTQASGPLRCEIAVSGPKRTPTFQGRVESDMTISGTYQMVIRRSGASGQALITQSGNFSVAPGAPANLGQATLGGDPAQFEVELELRWNGKRTLCQDRRGSIDI